MYNIYITRYEYLFYFQLFKKHELQCPSTITLSILYTNVV